MIDKRLTILRQNLDLKGVESIIISQSENRFYLSGFDGTAGFLFITRQESILVTDFRYVEQAGEQAIGYEVIQTIGRIEEWLPNIIGRLSVKNIGFESDHLSYTIYNRLCNIVSKINSKINLVPLKGLVDSQRAIKEPEEIKTLIKAVSLADAAMKYTLDNIRPGIREFEMAWKVEKFLRENGSQPLSFNIIIASGPNSALPHAKPTKRKIKKGEPVLIDLGAVFGKYTSDISRTIFLGKADDIFKRVYDIVLRAQQAAIEGIKSGMDGTQADNLARDLIEHSGYGRQFGHSLGHGLGLSIHEEPYLRQNSAEKLNNNMVFTIEPGIYIPGWGGVRLEDTVMLENGKIKVLSRSEKTDFWSSKC
ncbi:MAG: aminopeptidase P family protein [Dehalococcoidia bacterium]|nr:MAG: aminopeptidase P family protein [Dehalococcoidia bacterium]